VSLEIENKVRESLGIPLLPEALEAEAKPGKPGKKTEAA
jgi:hypothetical protein